MQFLFLSSWCACDRCHLGVRVVVVVLVRQMVVSSRYDVLVLRRCGAVFVFT